jgi:hypothetical protein
MRLWSGMDASRFKGPPPFMRLWSGVSALQCFALKGAGAFVAPPEIRR